MEKTKLLAKLLNNSPSNGGLNATNYPNPHGLRSYITDDGSYGGQMMPKGNGWLGRISDLNGNIMTEFSTGDEIGDFPALVPTLTQNELTDIVSNKNITPSAYKKAQEFANVLRSMGKNPFKDFN